MKTKQIIPFILFMLTISGIINSQTLTHENSSLQSDQLSAQKLPPPVVRFFATKYSVCVGDAVQFLDSTYNAPTAWNWTFNGGSPATSTLQHPVVTYTAPGQYNVVLQASNSDGADSKGELNFISVLLCTSIESFSDEASVMFFPNPVHSILHISSTNNATFTLHNLVGTLLIEGSLQADTVERINVGNYPAGIYFLSFKTGANLQTYKVIKQ